MSNLTLFPFTAFKQAGWRCVVIIQGDHAWRTEQATQLCQAANGNNGLIFTHTNNQTQAGIKHYQQWLGQEFDYIWIDSQVGLNPDAICALAGSIKAGGVLVLTLSQDILIDDPDIARFMPWQAQNKPHYSLFIQRLITLTKASKQAYFVSQSAQTQLTPQWLNVPTQPSKNWQKITHLTPAQIEIIDQVSQKNAGHYIITAERGRGKSATLGTIAAKIRQTSPLSSICITAPAKNCTLTCQAWFKKSLISAQVDPKNIELDFNAPDALLQNKPVYDVLIIDEAAALPAQILKQLAQIYPFIVYATTEHGYEGSGKGFSKKFINQLKLKQYTLAQFSLEKPIRWAVGDPLENWLNRVFLLNAEPNLISASAQDSITWLSKTELLQHEHKLQAVFGLLIQAHYRTTPSDLRYLLDSPDMQVCIMQNQAQQIIGVCLISIEGPLPATLASECQQGKRRPNGHLTPQLIAAQTGYDEFAKLAGWRIVRIAVDPQCQQQGHGSQLLNWLYQQATIQNIDYLASSFATSANLFKFWLKNQFNLARSSTTAETNTGLFSSLVMRPLSAPAKQLLQHIAQQNHIQIRYLLTTRYQNIPADLIWLWLSSKPIPQLPTQVSAQINMQFIHGFAFHASNYFSAQATLAMYCIDNATHVVNTVSEFESALLYRALLSQWEMKKLCLTFNLSGKKAVINKLREIFALLLVNNSK
ncbi:GNAT family N-acetyltransferase [Catenovulum adriaticum]|uniref:GNAT family N-acetyltransferase n=1 Tax=Catenovulum adriaticum TaxID=2984846 RepID=A0ABY7AR45_9ALTE|nr:GNAT family N-acetyltransferase [Catenovulum sp. TS8]WAJ70960.1 GNAT family N-acetyltransferase [Catenovulum sp. TS8]